MDTVKIILSLILCGVIGYGTNYIAVKMLFRPRKAVKVLGKTLPFTPGIIPKNQGRLAKALGNTVGQNLFTSNDIKNSLLGGDILGTISKDITNQIFSDESLKSRLVNLSGDELYDSYREKLSSYLTATIISKIHDADVGQIIINEGSMAIKEKTSGTMMAMFVTDDLIASLASPIGEKINSYIDNQGGDYISNAVDTELENLEQLSTAKILTSAEINRENIEKSIEKMLGELISTKLDSALTNLDIPAVVEQKVNAMDVRELEDLVMGVMKNELNAVINLGAIIGIIIGILNIFIQKL